MYKLNNTKKTISCNISKLTQEEKEIVQMYVNAGYLIKTPAKRKADTRTIADLKNALKDDKKNLELLNNKIANKENFMQIKKWFDNLQK